MSELITASYLRSETVGVDTEIETVYGPRLLTYCDYTASGRSLFFIENYVLSLKKAYANTHTEDDMTGRHMTRLLSQAEELIKQSVNAGQKGRLIATGTGATGAIDKFQQLAGVRIPPASWQLLWGFFNQQLGTESAADCLGALDHYRPVVFVGPYEHHSNEISWREGMATVVEVALNEAGHLDLEDLERLLQLPEYQNRLRIGSFSAASNVTGLISPVHEIAKLLHQHQALACFDYAASAPYVEINMNPSDEAARLDAIFISPHKYIGGPGASGVLVFRDEIYHKELAPSVGGGGTVDYVSLCGHDFIEDIEAREKAGTPGVLQTIRAALAMEVKQQFGIEQIARREHALLERAFRQWQAHPGIDILGDPDPANRVAIVSLNIQDQPFGMLHPRLVTVLLNDLFGIQSRAGCSCAGPYGHRLLGISTEDSEAYRDLIHQGLHGVKPGWCRVGFHYSMDDIEAQYVIDAVCFLADKGYHFLKQYRFEELTGFWENKLTDTSIGSHRLSIQSAMNTESIQPDVMSVALRQQNYQTWLEHAHQLADELASEPDMVDKTISALPDRLRYFRYHLD